MASSPLSCTDHLYIFVLSWCYLDRTQTYETQGTSEPKSSANCVQLCHGRFVCLHVPRGTLHYITQVQSNIGAFFKGYFKHLC